jgi:hypothetical protein
MLAASHTLPQNFKVSFSLQFAQRNQHSQTLLMRNCAHTSSKMSSDLEVQLLENIDTLFAAVEAELSEEEAAVALDLARCVSESGTFELLKSIPNEMSRNMATSAWKVLSDRLYKGYGKAQMMLSEYRQCRAARAYDRSIRFRDGVVEELRLARNAYHEPVEHIFGAAAVAAYGLEYIIRHLLPGKHRACAILMDMRPYRDYLGFSEQLMKDQLQVTCGKQRQR